MQRVLHRAERYIVKFYLRSTWAHAGYEQEARYFEEGVRHAKQAELAEQAQQLLHGAFARQLTHLSSSTLCHLNADMVGRDPSESFTASAARLLHSLSPLRSPGFGKNNCGGQHQACRISWQGIFHEYYSVLRRLAAICCTAVCGRHKKISHAALVCRSRAKAISAFQEGLQSLTVKGTTWDVQQPVADVTAEIDAHLSRLRAQKVIRLLFASLDWCLLPCEQGRLAALSAQDILQ